LISEGADLLLLWSSFHLSLLALLYCAVMTFKYFFNRQGRLGAALGRLSYGVYIVHIAALGPIALVLLGINIPGILKYPLLALTTWVGCNLLVYVYWKTVKVKLGEVQQPVMRQVS
jgi:peptidoglycan/LPS O-acetylase OafA/YrhL